MKIKRINISQLEAFIQSGEYLSCGTVIPITPERAFSQAANPLAKADDPALWIAFSDANELLGFIGSLPAFDHRGSQRMGWNSCWWVDPDRGKEAAMPLFYTFLTHWEMKVAFSDMTSNTYSIIRAMDFCTLREEDIFTGYFRFSFKEAFLAKKRLPYPLAPIFALLIPLINLFQSLRISTTGSNLSGLEMEVKQDPDKEIFGFIERHSGNDFARRDEKDFKWIGSRKWLVSQQAEGNRIGERYPFSYSCEYFEWKWIVTRQDGQINTVMFASERDHVLKVLYYFGDAPGFAMMALKSLICSNTRIRRIVLAHPALLANRTMLRSLLITSRLNKRYTGISKKLMDEVPADLIMQLGDGDALFT